MIGSCDCCDRKSVPVCHFGSDETSAQCETTACFICQGDTEIDPYGEMADTAFSVANHFPSQGAM
jgi:hypothetical protein